MARPRLAVSQWKSPNKRDLHISSLAMKKKSLSSMHNFFHYCFLLVPVHKEDIVVWWLGPSSLTQSVQSKVIFFYFVSTKTL